MSYTLKFEHPHFPKDYEFAFSGLGTVKNGSSVEITEDQERMFIADRGQSLEDAFPQKEGTTILSGSSAISADEMKTLLPTAAPVVEAAPVAEAVPANASGTDNESTQVITPPDNEAVTENE